MTKADLVTVVAEKVGFTKKDTEAVVSAMMEAIIEKVSEGEKVQLIGFGTFEARTRAARDAVNPITKQPMHLQETVYPAFKAGKGFKDQVNK